MNKLSLVFCVALTCGLQKIQSEIPQAVFQKYKRGNVLFLVGLYASVTFETAMNAGYKVLYGIDSDEVLVKHTYTVMPEFIAYWRKDGVVYKTFHGEPATDLLKYSMNIKEPITFVLSGCFPDRERTVSNTVLAQLYQIASHEVKGHVIMIEYVQHAGTERFGHITREQIQDKILGMDLRYRFILEKGGHLLQESDAVLVAYIP
jgi:hypothetical protein